MAGVINSIRTRGSVILVVLIGLAMLSFVLTDVLSRVRDIFYPQKSLAVGTIADEEISPDFFKYRVDLNVNNEKIRTRNQGGGDINRDQIENYTWNEVMEEVINNKEYEKLKIEVTDKEYADMIGGNPPDEEVIRILGTPDKIREYIKKAEKEPELKFQLQMLENYLQKNRLRNKYNSLIRNGVFMSKAEARRKYIEENKKISFDYLGVNFSQIPDKDIKVTDSDFKNYYQSHIEEFRQIGPEAIINYVKFDKFASKSDSTKAFDYLKELIAPLRASTDDSSFCFSKNRSNQMFNPGYQPISELDPDVAMRVENTPKDSIVGPFVSKNKYLLVKVSGVRNNPAEPFLKLRHIFIAPKGNTAQDTATAMMQAQIQSSLITSENFMQYLNLSDDPSTKNQGGELGFYRYGSFGKEFDDAVKKLEKGKIASIKSKFGAHIVEVMDKQAKGIKLGVIGYDIEPGSETVSSILEKAEEFRSNVKDTTTFAQVAGKSKYIINRSAPLTITSASQNFIPGLVGSNIKEIITWSLNGKQGQVCDRPFEVDNAIVVAVVALKSEGEYKSLEYIKEQIRPMVLGELKSKFVLEKLQKVANKGDLEAIRAAYGEGAFTQKADNVTFASAAIPGFGQDNKLVGKLFNLPVNKLSAPIVGSTGVYIVKVTNITEPEKKDDKALEEYRNGLLTTKRMQFVNKAVEGLRDWAKIKDNRYNFGY
jgi:peptidyl-prolyl cis-trans isomerase D